MIEDIKERKERPAFVQFEQRPVEDVEATKVAGRSICKNVDYVLVTPPYSKDCFEYKAKGWFENQKANLRNGRIPQDWLDYWTKCYEHWKRGLEAPVNGSDIRNWPVLSPAQVKNLVSAGCRTIEDLAAANDEGLRRIGMGAVSLKNKAQAYLKAADDHGPLVMENAQLKNEIAQLKGTIASLENQIQLLTKDAEKETQETFDINDILDKSLESPEPTVVQEKTLAQQYEEIFGVKPHHRMLPETIQKKIDENKQ